MKQIKKSITFLAIALFCMFPFFATSLKVQAAEPVTYYLKYVDSEDEWRYQIGTWQDGNGHRELYYMKQDIKDGDLIVVDGYEPLELNVSVRINNLTVVHGSHIVVSASSFDNVFVINGSTAAVTGDVAYAEVYDSSVCNFNSNVGTLKVLSEKENLLDAGVAVVGTVNHLYAGGKDYKHFEFYNFAANTLRIEEGELKTEKGNYSETPQAATTTPSTTTPSTSTGSNSSSGEYDDVPKTGDIRFNPLWLVLAAGICFIGAYRLKKN